MGWLCDQVVNSNTYAIADFICPTPETRAAFGPAYVIWVDRVQRSMYEDTNAMFVPPEEYDVRVTAHGRPGILGEQDRRRHPTRLRSRSDRRLYSSAAGSPSMTATRR